MGKHCEFPKCPKWASFNFPGKSPIVCGDHKEQGMICVINKRCEFVDEKRIRCPKTAIFGISGQKVKKRCKEHILPGMVNLHHKKCIGIDKKTGKKCNKIPSFGNEGEGPKYCSDHREETMLDVHHKKCEQDGCKIIGPRFNYPEEKSGRFCEKDKLEGMVNVVDKKCEFPNCPRISSFNFAGEKERKFCSEHKSNEMIDVAHKKCEFLNCPRLPCFNFHGEKGKRLCSEHKINGMVDVLHKTCSECDTIANFGPLFGPKLHCSSHKTKNEFRDNNPICEEGNCSEKALYTNDGTNYPRRCEDHKIDNDVNIVEKPCKKCNLPFFLNDKLGLCDYCNDFFIKQVHKKKETEVIEFLKNSFQFTSTNKVPEGACSKYRPDGVIDFLHFLVIVEIDEHQHNSYPEKCEMSRMIQIHQDGGGIPIIFLRYNPDTYKVEKDGKKENIKPNSKHRLNELYKVLKGMEILRDEYESKKYKFPPLAVCYLFYDNYIKPKLEEINIDAEIKNL